MCEMFALAFQLIGDNLKMLDKNSGFPILSINRNLYYQQICLEIDK